MTLKWSIGLMTGTVNDGFIDIAALRTDGKMLLNLALMNFLLIKTSQSNP